MIEEYYKYIVGIIIGLLIGYFLLWGEPYSKLKTEYNDLNSKYTQLNEDYNLLYQNYQKIKEENEAIQEDVGKLLIDYYGKELVWDISGISKYRRAICGLRIVLRGKVPLVDAIPC